MRIAIIDDEEIWTKKVKEEVRQFFGNVKVDLHVYLSGEAFLKRDLEYQIVFMDIEMPGRDGFSVLKEYRNHHRESLFIIVTTHLELSCKGYQADAFRFVDKFNPAELGEALNDAMLRLEKYQTVEIAVPMRGTLPLQCFDIVFFEVYSHKVLMHTKWGKTFPCVLSLHELFEQLEDRGFIFVTRSYLVNMEHIRRVAPDGVYLEDGTVLPLSRRRYAEVQKSHFEWKMKRANG